MQTYTVEWRIEIEARTPLQAAKKALEIHRDQTSLATVFEVYSEAGKMTEIDLTDIGEDQPRKNKEREVCIGGVNPSACPDRPDCGCNISDRAPIKRTAIDYYNEGRN